MIYQIYGRTSIHNFGQFIKKQGWKLDYVEKYVVVPFRCGKHANVLHLIGRSATIGGTVTDWRKRMTVDFFEALPAGTYIIGDPAYIIPNDDWDNFVNTVSENEIVKFKLNDGREILVWYSHTEFGDGEYAAGCYLGEHQLPVDSGTIGVIEKFSDTIPDGTFEYSTKKKFVVESKDRDGLITIGPWEIQTGDEPDNFEDPFFIDDVDEDD